MALDPIQALTITRDDLFTFLRRQPDAAIRILQVLASRLRCTDDILGDALLQDAL